jgi:hypothetical protein
MRYFIVIFAAVALTTAAGAKSGQGRFCLTGVDNAGTENCSFQTMASCIKSKTGNGDTCHSNPARTTGSGSRDK